MKQWKFQGLQHYFEKDILLLTTQMLRRYTKSTLKTSR